jgi:hypothetical protein
MSRRWHTSHLFRAPAPVIASALRRGRLALSIPKKRCHRELEEVVTIAMHGYLATTRRRH